MQKNISTTSSDGQMMWTNIINAGTKEIQYLKRKYKFHDLDLNDSKAQKFAQRPKFNIRNGYCFLILQFPYYNKKTKTVESEEIDFFIGWDYIVTIHRNSLPLITEFFDLCNKDSFYRNQYFSGQSGLLLYEIISRLQQHCYPILDNISKDIKKIEDTIFTGYERRMINEILEVKRNILNFRKIMQAHGSAIMKLSSEKISFLNIEYFHSYFNNLIENTKDIWDILSNQKEMLDALEETNTNLVSFKLSDIMRTLTLFSVVIFPLTLIASLFGMNISGGMPLKDSGQGFWIIVAFMLGLAFLMYLFFKKKKWL